MSRLLANALGFQLVWLATVAGAGHGMAWTGPLAAVVFAGWVLSDKRTRSADIWLLMRALPIGYASDSLWAATGWIHFNSPWPGAPLAPFWILALWVGFILSINHSLQFLHGRTWLAGLLGAVSGPAAYYAAGNGFAAISFGITLPLMIPILALGWALLLPMLLGMSAYQRARTHICTTPKPTEVHK